MGNPLLWIQLLQFPLKPGIWRKIRTYCKQAVHIDLDSGVQVFVAERFRSVPSKPPGSLPGCFLSLLPKMLYETFDQERIEECIIIIQIHDLYFLLTVHGPLL